jgi:hypothetical protein
MKNQPPTLFELGQAADLILGCSCGSCDSCSDGKGSPDFSPELE